jgi:hypothetical protein
MVRWNLIAIATVISALALAGPKTTPKAQERHVVTAVLDIDRTQNELNKAVSAGRAEHAYKLAKRASGQVDQLLAFIKEEKRAHRWIPSLQYRLGNKTLTDAEIETAVATTRSDVTTWIAKNCPTGRCGAVAKPAPAGHEAHPVAGHEAHPVAEHKPAAPRPEPELRCHGHQQACEGACVDVLTDHDHCGECGTSCTFLELESHGGAASCHHGTCKLSCDNGLKLCEKDCVDTSTDDSNCGHCGHVCPSDRSNCRDGKCFD